MIIPANETVMAVTLKFKMSFPNSFIKSDQRDGDYIPNPLPEEIVKLIYDQLSLNLLDITNAASLVVSKY